MTNVRRTLARWVVGALFALLIASFALWGIGDIFRGGGQSTTVIEVGDQEIDQVEFSRMFQREMRRVRQAMGGDMSLEEARRLGLVDRIVEQTVTRALFDAQAREMGLVVSDAQVARTIRSQQAFQNAVGDFDRNRFRQALRSSGLSEARFIELVRGDIDRERLARAVTSGIAVPEELAEAVYRYQEERRIAKTARIPFSSVQDVPQPTGSDLRTYYEQNSQAFMAPEYREVSLIRLRPEQLAQEVNVSEEELRQAYEERRDTLGRQEKRSLKQVLVDDRETAERILDQMRQGRTFAAAAEQIAGDAPIDLGAMTRDEMLPELAEAAFALSEGETSEPVESSLGWHLIRVTEIQPGETPSFEEARETLREDIAMRKAVDRMVSMANDLDDALAGGATLEEAAANLGLTVHDIPAVDRDGRDRQGEPVEALSPKEETLPVIFETAEGQQSLVKETPQGGYFVLRVDGVIPSQLRPFEEVRETVRERWLASRREEQARARAEQIVQGVNQAGRDFDALAREAGLSVSTTDPVTRSAEGGQVPTALAGALFDLSVGEATVASAQDGVVVAQLVEVREADPQDNPEALAQVRRSLRQGLQGDILTQFANALRQQHGVRVNRTQLDNALARF